MKIEWINHASFIIETDDIALVCDPWIKGRVFNNSWSQIAPSVFSYEDFSRITHIWFSHEHPDHFFPPNIKSIPEHLRTNITVLYQKTKDKKVIDFCQKLGFKTLELIPLDEVRLSENVTLINSKVSNDSDSWLYLKSSTGTLLNLNDCVFSGSKELNQIHALIGDVDVLFTQFSYANWVGNVSDEVSKNKHALEKTEEIKRNITVFNPRYTVPFASYVWFCAEENFHMNFNVNTIDDITKFISNQGSIPVVMYPGDIWNLGLPIDNQIAINKYLVNFKEHITKKDLTQFENVQFEVLHSSAESYRERHLKVNNKQKLKSYEPFVAYLTDWKKSISFSYRNGLVLLQDSSEEGADISFPSQNLKYCFDHDWGWSTIMVAGTFQKPIRGNFRRVEEYQWISTLNNTGKRMPGFFTRLINYLRNMIHSKRS